MQIFTYEFADANLRFFLTRKFFQSAKDHNL